MSHAADLTPQKAPGRPESPRSLKWPIVFVTLALIFWVGVFGQLVIVAPRIMKLLIEFRMRIPYATALVVIHPGWVIALFALWVAVAVVGMIFLRGRWRSVCLFLWMMAPLILNLFVGLSLYLPYRELLEGLNGNGPKL